MPSHDVHTVRNMAAEARISWQRIGIVKPEDSAGAE